MSKSKAPLLIAGLGILACAFAVDKKDLSARYEHKYLVVLQDGLAVGICAGGTLGERSLLNPEGLSAASLHVRITAAGAYYVEQANSKCGITQPELVHKGEILFCQYAYLHRGNHFTLVVDNVSPHSVSRGVGAFGHSSYERGEADLRFEVDDPKDYDSVQRLTVKWFKVFDSQDDAAKFGNTASGAFVKEVKLGMTPAEVEAALGLPETKVDLGEKVLYKYKNMTVEFHDGKVTDVR